MSRVAISALLVVLGNAGCLSAFGPDVGPPQQQGSDAGGSNCDTDSDAQHAVSFATDIVNGVFARGDCRRCHLPGGQGQEQSGFDISTYATLRAGGTRSRTDIVISEQPCASVLWQKVGPAPPFGARMPRDASPLSAADRQLIHDWISEGARDN